MIRIASAVFCLDAHDEGEDGFVVKNPIGPILVPAALRLRLTPGQLLPVTLGEPMKLALVLFGGKGVTRLRATAKAASGEYAIGGEVEFTWPPGVPWHHVVIPFEADSSVYLRESGRYEIGLLANGEPLGSVAIPLFWDDEV